MKQPKLANLATTLLSEADPTNNVIPLGKIFKQASEHVQEAAEKPEVDQVIQRHIGRKLKASYEQLVKQPVPDKFKALLEELQRKETKQ